MIYLNFKSQLHKYILSASFLLPAGLAHATADYYKCNHREGGEWNYGRAPNACDASAFGDDNIVLQDFGPVIFQDTKERVEERKRYMSDLHAVIRDAAIYYLKKRKPDVSNEELSWWVLGIMTTASQESYWSHYRTTADGRIKMMRGDFGHGHGIMQVDDRAHFNAIEKGYGWNLANHFAYAMDIFYKAWERAPSQSCVNSDSNYSARIRSAWSAYNGGPSKICRWQNSFDAWSQNDKNFFNQLSNRRWQNYVNDINSAAKVNISCLMENTGNCAFPTSNPPAGPSKPEGLIEGQLYAVNDGKSCILLQGIVNCIAEQRDRVCLRALRDFDSDKALSAKVELISQYPQKSWDRHQLCPVYVPTLFKVGEKLRARKNLNVRSAPGTGILAVVPANSVLPILDFEIRNQELQERYYKVQYQSSIGYIFGGNKDDFNQWASREVAEKAQNSSVASVSQKIVVKIESGINLRATPGGLRLTVVPRGAVLQVEGIKIQDTDNEVYYRVTYNSRQGYIYTGKLLPQETIKTWTVIQP